MSIQSYPLTWPAGWPRTTWRKSAAFTKYKNRLSVADGVERVQTELRSLKIKRDDTIISTNIRTRLDGLPRSDQPEPGDPGAAVYWEDKGRKAKVMAIDRYDRVADNLAAIAATLEAMRGIERHGGAQILDRAFTGFVALPAPPSCWDVLGIAKTSDPDAIGSAFRALAKRHHPDNGGEQTDMARLTWARDEAMRAARSGEFST